MRIASFALLAIAVACPAVNYAGFVWLDNQWDVTLDMNADKGEGSKQRAFGDVTAAVALARAEALAQTDVAGGGNSKFQAEVDFERGFQLSKSPLGWMVSLQGILSGSLSTLDPNEASSAFVDGSASILDKNQVPLFSIDTGGTKNDNGTVPWFEISNKNMKLDDGDYSVRGRLVTSALTLHDPLQGSAQSKFFDGGFAVSLGATPIPEPGSWWLVALLAISFQLSALSRRKLKADR